MISVLDRFARKPRIAILADRPDWAYDFFARNVQKKLSDQFKIDIYYVNQRPKISHEYYDILHVCFWGETYHHKFNFPPSRVIKEVSSHRWQYDAPYGPITTPQFVKQYLTDAHTVVATSLTLYNMLHEHHDNCYHVQNGFDPDNFFPGDAVLSGPLQIAWCGNAADPIKGVNDILKPATVGYALHLATGDVPQGNLASLYNQSDVYVVCSSHEAEPLTLIEAMACGCFPVCTAVGIVPELIRHKENGYIVAERSVEAFSEAFAWCSRHLSEIRAKRHWIADELRSKRIWRVCAQSYQHAWVQALRHAFFPVFRNDDVAPDTDVAQFKAFCNIFHSNAFTQVHAVTLSGSCNVVHSYGGVATEYANFPPNCYWKNEDIRRASQPKQMEDCKELVDYLNTIEDELAFHGTAHVDFSQMSAEEQDAEFASGIERMRRLFPHKKVRLFVPPFNRVNEHTEYVAAKYGLTVMKPIGVHLEEHLQDITVFTRSEYRYHHHRFYPQSQFSFYNLSLEALKDVLCKKVALVDSLQRHKRGQFANLAHKFSRLGLRIGRKVKRTAMLLRATYTSYNFWGLPIATISHVCRASGARMASVSAYCSFEKNTFKHDFLRWVDGALPHGAAILEAGCDSGSNLFALYKRGFANITGVESDAGAALACVRLQKKMSATGIKVEAGNFLKLVTQNRFNLIFSFGFQFADSHEALTAYLDHSKSLLEKEGYVIFDVIDVAYQLKLLSITDTLKTKIMGDKATNNPAVTWKFIEIEKIATNSGYEIVMHKFYPDDQVRSVYVLKLVADILH